MQVQLCRSDHADCLLRSGPASDAPFTTIKIKHGEEIKILSWEIVDGFIHVQAKGAASGWLRVEHILGHANGVIYKSLMDPEWYEQHWHVCSDHCQIRVLHGDSHPIREMRAMGFRDREISEMLIMMEECGGNGFRWNGHTFVCMDIGRPFRNGYESCRGCHITIAYAAGMSEGCMYFLNRRLDDTLEQWKRSEPKERPDTLLRLRNWEIKRPEEVGYDSFSQEEIARKPWRVVEELMAKGLIDSTSPHPQADLPGYVERLYNRDVGRLNEARCRATMLRPHKGVLDMMRCDEGLGGNSHELYDLLEYLADIVLYFPAAHYLKRNGRLVPPYITKPSKWHCTRQSNWKRTIVP